MYNILLYDCLNKCNFIYNINPVLENDLHVIFDSVLHEIKQTFQTDELHVSYINNTECEVYIYKEHLSKGWVWNSIVHKKQVLFKLQVIACLPIDKELTLLNTKACQTHKFEKFYIGVSCQSDNNVIEEIENDDEFYDIPLESVALESVERQINYNCEIKDILNLEKYGLYKYKKD